MCGRNSPRGKVAATFDSKGRFGFCSATSAGWKAAQATGSATRWLSPTSSQPRQPDDENEDCRRKRREGPRGSRVDASPTSRQTLEGRVSHAFIPNIPSLRNRAGCWAISPGRADNRESRVCGGEGLGEPRAHTHTREAVWPRERWRTSGREKTPV